ncbi:DUF6801 domain-containing protein [Streptomyces sp. NPDC058045]|uniref:DUF6801 domain-containing protein n=1 Tax=Streptomyces sp. NPDC058045 TaxID=3346311 RepID=UPI0036E67871
MLVIAASAAGTGVAAARSVSLTLRYTCHFPVIGGQPVTVRATADLPASHTLGTPTPRFPIRTVTTVSPSLTGGLRFLGVHSVEGTAGENVQVAAPQGDFNARVPFSIPKSTVPKSGSFPIPASGTAPSLTFRQQGRGKLTAGDINLHLVPRNADGDLTYLGELDVPCTPDGGQNKVIESFTINPPAPTTSATSATSGATPTTTTAPAPSGRTASGGATATASPSEAGAPGSTATPTTGSPSATAAEPTRTSTTDGTPTYTTGTEDGHSNSRTLTLLTAGACAAAAGAAAYGRALWRRHHPTPEGFMTVSQPEEVPDRDL